MFLARHVPERIHLFEVRPLVSGTSFHMNTAARMLITP